MAWYLNTTVGLAALAALAAVTDYLIARCAASAVQPVPVRVPPGRREPS